MTITEMTDLSDDTSKTKDEKIRILRKVRAELLNEIHAKQQLLDQVDYTICEIKKK